MTTSGAVVMNLPPPPPPSHPFHLSGSVCQCYQTHILLISLPLFSGIEQSLSVRPTEAENTYENPQSIRLVMNLDILKCL